MIIQKISAAYFSPTGTTKKVAKSMLTEFIIPQKEIDLTPYENRNNSYSFRENELVLIGIPVYGGQVPSIAEERITQLKGENTPAILFVTYGNVHFFDALFDLQKIVVANGFIPVAAAAIVSEHNVVKGFATGRPNSKDLADISTFIRQAKEKISRANHLDAITVKGATHSDMKSKIRSRLKNRLPIKPHATNNCTNCGVCVKLCPIHAISNPRKTAGASCICCMRCIRYCPQKARTYGKAKEIVAKGFLKLVSRGEKQLEFFL